MLETKYIIWGEKGERKLPYIEKDGLKIIARPLGQGAVDGIERELRRGQTYGIASLNVGNGGELSPTHPELDVEQIDDNRIRIKMEVKPAGFPGYNISFPTKLGIGDCIQTLSPVLNLYSDLCLDFSGEDYNVLIMYASEVGVGVALSPPNGGMGIRDEEAEERYRNMIKELRMRDLIGNYPLLKILENSSRAVITNSVLCDEDPQEGRFVYFWYQTNGRYEDKSPYKRAFVVNATHYDQNMFDVVARASEFPLGDEEFGWLKSLFE